MVSWVCRSCEMAGKALGGCQKRCRVCMVFEEASGMRVMRKRMLSTSGRECEGRGANGGRQEHQGIWSEANQEGCSCCSSQICTFLTNPLTTSLLRTSSASLHKPSMSYVLRHSDKSAVSLIFSVSTILPSALPSVRACRVWAKTWSRSDDRVDCIRSMR